MTELYSADPPETSKLLPHLQYILPKMGLFNGTRRSETVEMASTDCTWQYRASNHHSCSIITFRPIKTNLIQRIEVSTLDKCVLGRLMAPTWQTASELGKCASRFKWNVVNLHRYSGIDTRYIASHIRISRVDARRARPADPQKVVYNQTLLCTQLFADVT